MVAVSTTFRGTVRDTFMCYQTYRMSVSRTRTETADQGLWRAQISLALATGVGAVAGSYLLVGRRPAFVVTPFDRFVLAASPDALVAFAITQLGGLGHQLAFVSAVALTCGTLALLTLPGVVILANGRSRTGGSIGTLVPGVVVFGLTGSGLSSVGAMIGVAVVLGAATGMVRWSAITDYRPVSPGRRRVLGAIGSALSLSALGMILRRRGDRAPVSGIDIPDDADPEVRALLNRAKELSLNVEGLEPLVSPDFYEVDINNINPDESRDTWTLSVTGAVETEVEYDFSDIESMPVEHRFATLRCVGDQLNGYQMDNALWSGVPAEALLEDANPRGDRVILRGVDGYYNEFHIDALMPGLFAHRMNGRPLPRAHGYPIRALVPGHWGEINVKWLTEIEVQTEDTMGYWEYRDWQGTGEVNTVAKIWQVNHLAGPRIEVAGHAYAGTRGIKAVEVSTDGGESWVEAELSEPLPGTDVWRQWRFVYSAVESHEVIARARDQNGDLQKEEKDGPRPDGATGWVSKPINPH